MGGVGEIPAAEALKENGKRRPPRSAPWVCEARHGRGRTYA